MLAVQNVLVVVADGPATQAVWSCALAWQKVCGASLHLFMPLAPGAPAPAPWPDSEGKPPASRTVLNTPHWCEAVLHEARRRQADLLLIGADETPQRELQHLLRQLPCPVYLARRGTAPRRIAAAIGLGSGDELHRLLNTVVLEHQAALARLWGAERKLLSAIPSPADLTPLIGDAYAVNYVGTEFEQTFRQRLEEQAAPFGLTAGDIHTAPGRPDVMLPDLVREQAIDCLLLGTIGRQALAAFWLGNTAEDVLPRVDCDVMVLRPQDYYTPT